MKRRGKSIPRRMVFDREQSLSVVGSSSGSSGSGASSTDAASLGGYVADDFELDLGVPTSNGYALVSDIDGIRSWINILEVNLAGFSAGVGGTVTESDSIRTGLQKLEYRVALDDAKVSFPGFGTTEGTACEGNDARLSDSRTPLAHNQASSTISDSTEAGRAILTAADAAAQRTSLGLGSSATHESSEYAPASALTTKADLVNGLVPSSQLPSYVDDVLEFSNLAAFPVAGESGKIYVALDTNLAYRWSGSTYTEISPSIALGETAATAYRGDRGKDAYDHSQVTSGNPHGTTPAQIGAPSGSGTCSGNNTGDQTLSGLGGVPLTRKITSTIDLSEDRNLTASDVGALAVGGTAADSSKLGGLPVTASGARWSCIPTISAGGVMEVGKYLDFHDTAGDTGDYSVRIATTSAGFTFTGNMATTGGLSVNNGIAQYMYANSAVQYLYRINGSVASPTPVLNGDIVSILVFGGQYSTTGGQRANGALISAVAVGDYTGYAVAPTDVVIQTAGATGTPAERLRVTSGGATKLASTEDCTGAGTGTLQNAGGQYVAKTSWMAGLLSIQGGMQLKRTTVSDSNSTGAVTDVYVVQTGTMSAPRTHTLPLASSLKAGQPIAYKDESGTVGATNTWTLAAQTGDTIESASSLVISEAYGGCMLVSNGVDKYTRWRV